MLSRLPVLLSEIHAGNNSTKRKNEIRQLLYSLYRSRKISKAVYNIDNRSFEIEDNVNITMIIGMNNL